MDDLIAAIGAGAGGASMDGWAGAGKALGGIGAGSQDAYLKGQERGVSLTTKIFDARKKRDEALARQETVAKLVATGVPAEQAELLGNLQNANNTSFGSHVTGLGNLQDQGIQRQQMGVLGDGTTPPEAGQLDLVNIMNMIRNGKPVDRTKVQGNTMIDPGLNPAAQTPETTPYGEGVLGNAAQRNENYLTTRIAAANEKRAKTEAKERKGTADEDAETAYYDMRASGTLPKGVTIGDVKHAFRTKGGWTSEDAARFTTPSGKDTVEDNHEEVQTTEPNQAARDAEAVVRDAAAAARQPTEPPPQPADFRDVSVKVDSTGLPPQAASRLREGVETTFGNGQTWSLQGGKPVRIK